MKYNRVEDLKYEYSVLKILLLGKLKTMKITF